MKQKLLFALLAFMFAAFLPVSAQDVEITEPPVLWYEVHDEEVVVYFDYAEESTIYAFIDGVSLGKAEDFGNVYVIERGDEDQEVEITAYAVADGKEPSETVEFSVYVPAREPEITASPEIWIEETDEQVIVHFYCPEEAVIYGYINWEPLGDMAAYDNMCAIERSDVDQYIDVAAYAVADGKEQSEMVVETIYVAARVVEITASPVIVYEETEEQVFVHFYCPEEATIYAYIDGVSLGNVEDFGYVYVIERGTEDQYIDVAAYAVAEGKEQSETVVETIFVAARVPEQTEAPIIYCGDNYDGGYTVNIESSDPNAVIYYRVGMEYGEYTDWMVYSGELWFTEPGHYNVEAYAIAEGKTESEHVMIEFMVHDYDVDYTRVYDFMVDGIYYKILDNSSVAVTKQYVYRYNHYFYYSGDVVWMVGQNYPAYSGEVTIPETVEYRGQTYTVTAIADESFWDCNVTSVTIPSTVTYIGNYAFGRSKLVSIELPAGLTIIGEAVFANCPNLTSVTIPASVTDLGQYAFARCTALTNLSMSGSFPSIGKNTFSNCSAMTGVNIPASVTTIGERAFYNCKKMSNVTIPAGVTTIGDAAFSGCSAMTGITLPSSLTTLGTSAFMSCTGLTGVVIPAGVTAIANSTFSGCTGLTTVGLSSSLTSIGSAAFSRCYALTEVVIPETVTSLGNSVFNGCRGLTSVSLSSAITAINYSTFQNCTGLTSIVLPASLTSISYDAFNGCSGLTGLIIPAAVTAIGERAFDNCPSIASIQVESGNGVFDSREDCNAIIKTASGMLQLGCKNTVVPATVTAIGDHAFYNCDGLTAITLPEGLTCIGSYAFYNCTGLTQVTLPATVDTIRTDAFYCSGLTAVTSLAEVPPVTYSRTFMTCYDATLRVPQSSLQDYKSADYWREFSRIMSTTDPEVGDVDGNGTIGISDVSALIDYILSHTDDDEYLPYADVDNDGKIGISDLSALIDMILSN